MKHIFPLITDAQVREIKALISIHTSNSYLECDRMFVPDFLYLDDIVHKEAKQKLETAQSLLNTLLSR
jgi:hypothetical protein